MLRERPEYLQQSLDYLVAGYHYYSFTKHTALPVLDRLLEVIAGRPEYAKPIGLNATTPLDSSGLFG